MSVQSENVYCFVSGKNWKLSLAEITAYLTSRNYQFKVSEFSRSFFTIKTQRALATSIIDDLGGTLKLMQTTTLVPTEHVAAAFIMENKQVKKQLKVDFKLDNVADNMAHAPSGKAVFGVSVYWSDPVFRSVSKIIQRFLGSAIKDELKVQNKKARFMGFPRDRENPQLTPVEVLKQGLIENRAEILLCIGKQQTAIGATLAVHNPFEFQKRDVDKPVQRKIFGMSPRLAKIMVNLSHCEVGTVFLDPFCGVGTILQEALLAQARVIGVDINRWCVDAAKRNLEWLTREYSLCNADYAVLHGDARNLKSKLCDEINCIVTEPDLGPALREVPTVSYAKKIIFNLKPLFEGFLLSAYVVLQKSGYLVVVTPYIKTRSSKPVTMNIVEMAQEAGFEAFKPFNQIAFVEGAADFPLRDMVLFVDVDDRHKIGRKITVFRK